MSVTLESGLPVVAEVPALAAMFNVGTSQIWRVVNDKQRT